MKLDLNNMPAFGVAGNFTGHLEQAGEARDFVNVKTLESGAPKAIFPTFIPNSSDLIPSFLNTFPFDSEKIIYPQGEDKLQIEPECAIVCKAVWGAESNKTVLQKLIPEYFGASNDCSIRKEGATKISQKKNWGLASKGFSKNPIKLDVFAENGNINDYRIASFLVRGSEVFVYGEDSAVRDYSYVYEKLLHWCIDKFNNQKNEGPAEEIHSYLTANEKLPDYIFVSIGATRYTDYGQHNFLQNGDKSVVIVYPESKYSDKDIFERVSTPGYAWEEDISVLIQTVESNS